MKTWGEMSDEEQGALLLAHHRGEVIEFWIERRGEWVWIDSSPDWFHDVAYRVRPKTLTGETYLTALETYSPLMTNTPIKGMSCCIKGVYTVEFKDNKPVRMTWEASDAD